jgi:hypothetical protein
MFYLGTVMDITQFLTPAVIGPIAAAVVGFFAPQLVALVKLYIKGDMAKAIKVVLAAVDEARAQWPDKFNDPQVSWVEYVEDIAKSALAGTTLKVDPSVVALEVVKVFSAAKAIK